MSKKLILFLMVLLFGSANFLRADEVMIGDGTSTTYVTPFNSLWGYSYVEQIFTADEIGMAGTINSISFNMQSTDAQTNSIEVFMKNVTRETFASADDFEAVTAADMVYSGTVTFNAGWTTITLDTPFAYDGTSNLMIGMHEGTSGYSTRYFYYTSKDASVVTFHSDSANPNPYDLGSYSGNKYVSPNRSNIILDITAGGGGGGGVVAGEITVHDGTATNSYVPVYGFYADAYLKSEMVYPAAELADMAEGTINSIKFYTSTPAAEAWTSTWQVFVAEVADATINDFYGPGTVVYEGTLDGTGAEMEITFDTPYAYNGGNLLIGVYTETTGNYKSVSWAGETVDGASVQGYNYSSLSGISATQRNFLPKTTFYYEKSETPVPTDILAITPNPFELGDRPTNGWMEPMTMRIHNGLENAVTMTGNMSNTAGVNVFVMSEEIDNVVLEPENDLAIEIDINRSATSGIYTEQFTLFYVENSRDITVVPVTAKLYEAGEADIVETAKTIDPASFNETPTDLHANYFGYEQNTALDAVYQFTLENDSWFSVSGGTFIGIYNKVLDFHPTMAVEPVAMTYNGTLTDEILLAGDYYMIVAGDNITTISGNATEMPAPTEIMNLTPANFTTGVEGSSITLTWEGGDNAAEYQVLFGTSPTNTPVALDWTVKDANYGSFEATGLVANTQYFWQIKVRNSNGTVEGQRWGFTTALTAPNNVTASAEEIFTDESTLIKWKHNAGTGGFTGEITVADGTATSSYVPVYGLWADYYTRSEMIYPAEMLEEMEGGEITSLTFYLSSPATASWSPDVFQVYFQAVEATTLSSYYTAANATIAYTGYLDGTGTTMTIVLDEPYTYEGGNLLVGIQETVKGTWKSASFYGVAATGASASGYNSSALASVTFNQRDFLPKVTFNCGDAKANRAFMGFNLYYGDVKVNDELIQEKQYLLENLPYNVEPGHDINVTAVYDEGESGHSTPIVTVKVSGYATLEGTVTEVLTSQTGSGQPVAGATVTFYGKDEFNNDVNFETTTDNNGYYSVTVKAGIYNRGIATYAGMEPASMAEESVTVAYKGTETVNFIIHEEYKPVLSVYAEEIDPSMSKVTWSLNTAISGGGTGGNASTFTEGFEGGMPEGWTVVDANNDGYTWCMTSNIPSTWTYYASVSLDWYRTGTNAICSGSYINGAGALNPDEYLIMGQQMIANGSTLSFWAAATDASYPADHFGVFVSDDATNWTSVQEWTLTAKSGAANGGRASRDAKGDRLGTWYNYTVDLSSYAGQKYIAIRHFNCYDQYIMCVDDIELSDGSKNRSLDHYTVYRKAILKATELVEADSVQLVDNYTDTLYADFAWNNMEPGLYQYGVSAVYPTPMDAKGGNRDVVVIGDPTATTTNTYLPTYSLYEYSLTEQIYTADEIGMAGTINTLTMWLKNSSSYARNINVYMKEADVVAFADGNAWVSMTDSDMVASFTLANGITSPVETAIALTTPFSYTGNGSLVICFQDVTGSWSSGAASVVMTGNGTQAIYAYRDGTVYNPTTPGVTGNPVTSKSVIMLDITPGGGAGGNDDPVTPITWSNILPKDMETTVTVNALVAAGSVEGATLVMTNDFENLVYEYEFDETGTVTIEDFRKGNYVVTVALEGYTSNYAETEVSIWDETTINAELTEIFKPVDAIAVSCTGFASWTAVVPTDRLPEKYFMQLNNVYYGETTDNFIQINQDNLTVGQTYTFGVAVVYSTGMSAYMTTNFTYTGCEGVETQVVDLHVDSTACTGWNVALVWNGGTVTPTPPTPPTGNDFNFDDGTMMGWTSLDADGDGNGWVSSTNPGIYHNSGVNLSGTGHNASEAYVISGSYANQTGQALTPNNYLVSPAKAEYTGITFYACAQDGSYAAEHFGVAVSTGNATASDFTIVDEWTMTAKGEGAMSVGRDGQIRQGNWYQYTVDFSAYAGQQIWVAIRHFNCTDMFILNVDDITLGVPQKSYASAETSGATVASAPVRAMWDVLKTFNAAEGGQYGVVTDGTYIYTSNWGYSGATNNFYKYDMDGNVIEGFNISGCGTLRGMTFDGQYVYGVANSSTIYCVDLNNHTLVGTTTSAYGAMRCISYDPQRDGFWVVGNWSGNLTLIDRTGAIVQAGPAPTSASDVAYWKDSDGVEHVYCFNNGDNGVYDYNITTNTMGGQVFNFSAAPGFDGGSSGGCHIANYGDKLAFYGDVQQSPNLIAIYELSEAQGGGGQVVTDLTPNKFNISVDGVIVAATSNSSYVYTVEEGDYEEHVYEVFFVDAQYGMSCPQTVRYRISPEALPENAIINAIYPNPTSGDLNIKATAMTHISIVNTMGQVVYNQDVNADEMVIDMAKFESGVYMVNIITENGSSVKRVTVTK